MHTKFSTSSKGVCVWYKTNRLDIEQRKKQKAWSQLSKTIQAMVSIDISNSESGNCIELKLPLENKLLLLWKETFLAHTIGFTASTWTNWVWNFFRISDISECMRWSFESSARVVWEVFSLYSSLSVCGVVSHRHHRLEKVLLCCGGGMWCMLYVRRLFAARVCHSPWKSGRIIHWDSLMLECRFPLKCN